jgi:DNA-binding response OmpR family regulator
VETDPSGKTAAKPPNLRILVVEDERLARGALRLILELDGYDVRVTGNGSRALRVLKDFNPHIVIMDWRVSGLCGERLCDAMRRRLPNVPIIIISSSDEAFSSPVEVLARMRKPIDVRRLREVVAERIGA